MIRTLAQDTRHDVSLLETSHGGEHKFHVRYGLDRTQHATIESALDDFRQCLEHSLACEGYFTTAG